MTGRDGRGSGTPRRWRRRTVLAALGAGTAGAGCLRLADEQATPGDGAGSGSATPTSGGTEGGAAATETPTPGPFTGFEVRWQAGHDSPPGEGVLAVHDRTVYGLEMSRRLDVVARRLDDGAERWRAQLGEDHGGAVEVTADAVVAAGTTGRVLCLDPDDGTVRWRHDTAFDQLHKRVVVDGDRAVVAQSGPDDTSRLVAYDLASGDRRWVVSHEDFERHYEGSFTHGTVEGMSRVVDGAVYVGFTNSVARCDVAGGGIDWFADTAVGARGDLAVADGRVYVPTVGLATLATDDGERLWLTGDDQVYGRLEGGATIGGGRVYAGGDDNAVYAFDPESGNVEWRHLTEGAVRCRPAYHRGTVLAGSDDGTLRLLDPASGDRLAVHEFGSSVVDVAVGGTLAVCRLDDRESVVALDLSA